MVAQVYTQIKGLDFGETYIPDVRLEAIMVLLAYACAHNIKLYQMDVKSVFLNGYTMKKYMLSNLLVLKMTKSSTMCTS